MTRDVTRLSDRRKERVEETFADYSTEQLVTAVVMLTHSVAGTDDERLKDTYRARRDVAKREILRRCGEA